MEAHNTRLKLPLTRSEFRNATLDEWKPLTEGSLVPIIDDGSFYDICLFDPRRQKFVVKNVEEPEQIVREFDSWQSYLAYALLEIADSGPSDVELVQVAEAVGFPAYCEVALAPSTDGATFRSRNRRASRSIYPGLRGLTRQRKNSGETRNARHL